MTRVFTHFNGGKFWKTLATILGGIRILGGWPQVFTFGPKELNRCPRLEGLLSLQILGQELGG